MGTSTQNRKNHKIVTVPISPYFPRICQKGAQAVILQKMRHLSFCISRKRSRWKTPGRGNPEIKPSVIERVFYRTTCSCGHKDRLDVPAWMYSGTSENLQALIAIAHAVSMDKCCGRACLPFGSPAACRTGTPLSFSVKLSTPTATYSAWYVIIIRLRLPQTCSPGVLRSGGRRPCGR